MIKSDTLTIDYNSPFHSESDFENSPEESPIDNISTGEYNLEDEDEEEVNINAEDESSEEENDEDDNENDDAQKRQASLSPLRLLIEMMLNPISGWKAIRRSKISNEAVAEKCFFPIVGICALSCLLECIYKSDITLSQAMIEAVKVFVAMYLGNFASLLIVKILMPKKHKAIAESDFGKQFVMYLISTLAIFFTLYQCLPMIGPVLTFLPLWTIYLAMRGCRFFHFDEDKRNLLTTIISLAILTGPICVYFIFDMIL